MIAGKVWGETENVFQGGSRRPGCDPAWPPETLKPWLPEHES